MCKIMTTKWAKTGTLSKLLLNLLKYNSRNIPKYLILKILDKIEENLDLKW